MLSTIRTADSDSMVYAKTNPRMLQFNGLIVLLVALLAIGVVRAEDAGSESNFKIVPLYFEPVPVIQEPIKKGLLEYDIFLGTGSFKNLAEPEKTVGRGCFGTIDSDGKFKCLAFSNVCHTF